MNVNARMLDFSTKFDDPTFDLFGADLDNNSEKDDLVTKGASGAVAQSKTKQTAADLFQKQQQLDKLKKEESNKTKAKKDKKTIKNKPRMIEVKEMERKIEEIQKKHEQDLSNFNKVAKHQTVEFFKEKGEEINSQYQTDMTKVITDFDEVRAKYFAREKKIQTLVNVVARQEKINQELKTFICECLDHIFATVQERQPEI